MDVPIAIPIPPKSLARLESIIMQRQQLDAQVEVIITTLRETLNVPEDYVISDIRAGFLPAPQQEQQ